ncbi:DNA cytosine methyltransferase [Stenotrophomonas maltophilia]|nr:DNA cytosine methyltransferase [Stenotrophomonas maltophilia]
MLRDTDVIEHVSDKRSPSVIEERIESFALTPTGVDRHVRLRDGRTVVSSVAAQLQVPGILPEDQYDLHWLKSKVLPPEAAINRGQVRIADLFSGCGGLSVGIREACRALGLKSEFVFASDANDVALDVYKKNFDPKKVLSGPLEGHLDGKIGARRTRRELELVSALGAIDFVVAGPPCQGHSDLNNHTRRDDPKNQLVIRVARFAELFRPMHILIENVRGIKNDKLGSLRTAMDILDRLGYKMADEVLSADSVGVPQARKRFFLLASLENAPILSCEESRVSHVRNIGWAIDDLLNTKCDEVFETSATHSKVNQERIRYLFERDLYELPDNERPPCHRDKPHSYTGVYGRMKWDRPAPTITTGFGSAGQGRFVHPLRQRTLTPHEAARLQFFPDFFDFGDRGRRQYQELIGNAVPSKLAYSIVLNNLR